MNLGHDDAVWMKEFRDRLARERVPVSGILELTSRCNLKCVHCYLGPQEDQRAKRSMEMSTDRVLSLIDEMVEAGCLYLLITGGDPMVRKDFPEIYRHARERGLIVTIFCDGILASDAIVELFRELPPYVVEVSIYGGTAETYEAITRIPGSFPRALAGIQRLLDGGIRVALKTVLMEPNRHEISLMRSIAEDFGVSFRLDSAIFPCLPDRDDSVLGLRVSPETAVRQELLEDPSRVESWQSYIEARQDLPPAETTYVCGAGVTNFYVDPFGNASPCLMTTQYQYPTEGRSFGELWEDELGRLRGNTPRADYGCNSCEMRSACTGCPAFNYQENGAEDVKSDYVCATTNIRWNTLTGLREGLSIEAALQRAGAGAEEPSPAQRRSRFTILSNTTNTGCGSSCGCGD
ncbi:MAG: radical SAM protein [Thermoanaerobaculia bacterium]|nr:radical SAM protein [Thermoanaerobaculia bacterium]